MMEAGEYTVLRFTNLYELTCLGMVTKEYEVDVLATHIELRIGSSRFLYENFGAVIHFMLTGLCRKAEEKCQIYLHNINFLMCLSRAVIYQSILVDTMKKL